MHARHSSPLSNNKISALTLVHALHSTAFLCTLQCGSCYSLSIHSLGFSSFLYSFTHIATFLPAQEVMAGCTHASRSLFLVPQLASPCTEHAQSTCTTCVEDAHFLCTEPLYFHYVVITKYCLTVLVYDTITIECM